MAVRRHAEPFQRLHSDGTAPLGDLADYCSSPNSGVKRGVPIDSTLKAMRADLSTGSGHSTPPCKTIISCDSEGWNPILVWYNLTLEIQTTTGWHWINGEKII